MRPADLPVARPTSAAPTPVARGFRTPLPGCVFAASSLPPRDQRAGTSYSTCETRLERSYVRPCITKSALHQPAMFPTPCDVVAGSFPEPGLAPERRGRLAST